MKLDDPGQVMRRRDDTIEVDFWYPRLPGKVQFVEVGLVDVRAADSIRIHYDFHRDGYSIEQATKFEWGDEDDGSCDPCWKEVAFVQAWALEQKGLTNGR